jgi:ATP/ADP translocase/HEAT repeat protein
VAWFLTKAKSEVSRSKLIISLITRNEIMVARFLGNWFSIKPNEWDGVVYFFLVLLVFSFGASFARSLGMTLLVDKLGGEQLPLMFIFIDLAVMVGSILYAHSTKKFSGLVILDFFLLSTAVFSVIVQALFFLTTQFRWVYGFFFVGFFFFYILISIHVGSVIASYFTAVQVKRVTPVINAGFPIGGVLGGSTLIVLLNVFQFQPQQLVVVLGVACLSAFFVLRLINARLSPVRAGNEQFKSHKNPISELIIAFQYIVSSKLMIYMSLGLVLFVIANKLLEYHYQTIIYYEVFPDATQRATFFATYEVFANLAWLVVQLFFTSRIVMNWGVGASNVLYPVFSATVALALFIYFYLTTHSQIPENVFVMLGLGMITQFVNQEMRGALRTPTNNLLFNAIPPNQWGVNKAFLNGIVYPFSTVIAGTLLILMTGNNEGYFQSAFSEQQLHYLLPLIVFVVSVLGVLVAFPQWAAYDKGVFGLLHRDLFVERPIDVKVGGRGNSSLKQVIQQKLSSTDPYHVVAALEMIRVLRLNYFVNQVGNLFLKTQVFKVKEHCIKTLAALPQSHSNLTYLVEALQTEKDANVLPLILKNLARFKSVNFNDTIEKLLAHPTPKVFVEACISLHSHPSYRHKRVIEKKIIERLLKSKPPDTALYLYALGELRQSHYSNKVLPFMDNENPAVRLAAFTAFIRMLEGQLDPHKLRLLEALNSPDKEMKIVALRALKECQSLDNWLPIIRLLGAKDRALVIESKELLRLSLGICKPVLVETMYSDNISVSQRFEILSLIYPKLSNEQRQRLRQDADESLKKFIKINWLIKLHETIKQTSKAHDLIGKALQEIADEHLHHVLTIITFASDQNIEFFQKVSRGLQSLSRANQGNALEVLSNAKERYLVSRVLKYFDERINDQKAVNRIHVALFGESLRIDESHYEEQLHALNNDMIMACLLYIEQQKTGILKLEKVNNKVRKLLTES